MAKLMSKQTRETVVTSVVLAIIILFVVFYIIYPLIRVGDITSRPIPEDEEGKPIAFVMNNDATFYTEKGFTPDTLSMATEDNIPLAVLYFMPDTALYKSVSATAVLLHDISNDRNSLNEYVQPLLDIGMAVIIYDQRACGMSGGEYHTPGIYEGDDLNLLLSYLKIRDKIYEPVICIGFGAGGDAVLHASRTDNKIQAVLAIDPSLNSSNWMNRLKEKGELFSIPFSNAVYFYWYQKISGYPIERTFNEDIASSDTKSVIYYNTNDLDEDEKELIQTRLGDFITIRNLPENNVILITEIIELVRQFNNQTEIN